MKIILEKNPPVKSFIDGHLYALRANPNNVYIKANNGYLIALASGAKASASGNSDRPPVTRGERCQYKDVTDEYVLMHVSVLDRMDDKLNSLEAEVRKIVDNPEEKTDEQ
jgi:hypothetical protein